MPFNLPKGKPEFSKLEESILQYWKEDKTFEKSVESRSAENPYRFYDGPPFITGTPHYGSLLSSIIKDVIPRYQTMLGKRVERVWGWDCHGLPIEQKVQKKLGLESNKEIEESEGGIQKFIDECYAYTRETSSEWNWYVDHIGRWVDMDHAYRTMDQDYMESVMWVFKQIWEKGYVYEGKRVSWYSWKLSTPISNFEIAMDDSYQDVQDSAVTIKFPIQNVRKGSDVMIQDEAGKLLMIKNKKDGLWRFPGGKTDPGESYHDAAARELLEETGITCEITPYCTTYCGYRGDFYEALSFRGTVPVGTKVVLEDKFSEYEYFALDALPLRSEIHRMEYDLLDFLTGVREPVIVPEIPVARTVNILAWTTTPWTLPMHMALAVNRDLEYVAVYHDEEIFIVAASRVETVFKGKGDYQILATIPGEELVNVPYNAPFDFYQKNSTSAPLLKGEIKGDGIETDKKSIEKIPPAPSTGTFNLHYSKGDSLTPPLSQGGIFANSFKVYHADFVTDTDGTGIAHEAPEFGDVDFQLAKEKGIHITAAIDEAGKYTAEVPDYVGQLYLDCIDPICERLKSEGTLFKKESITHRVPYCPRSNTPLIQKAQKSRFIDIQRIKKELIEKNESINWFPDHFKHGRFLKSLESAPDWCISRSRFWGTPMPVWQNSDGSERVVIDSREELYERNKPLGQITKLIFVRHGESEANASKFYALPETSLSKRGKKQAQELVEILKDNSVDIIISSPHARTVETITALAEHLGKEVIMDERIREWDCGKFVGLPSDSEISKEETKKSYTNPDHKRGGGETMNDLIVRGKDFMRDVCKKYPGKTVIITSHQGFGKVFFSCFSEKDAGKYNKIENCEVKKLYIDNNTGKEINLHRPYIDRLYVPGKSFFTPKKVLGVHGWTSSGIQKGYDGKWLPLQDKLKAVGIQFDVPDFDKNKETTYSLWKDKLDTLDVASYDTVMATSFGCPVIMQYLCEKNIKLKRLVLVAPSGLKGNEYLEKVIPEMTEDVEKLRGLIDEIIIPHSEDDDSTSARFEYGKSLAKRIGAIFLPINGVGHKFGGWSIDFLSSLIQNGAPLGRIPEVLDVWMDSASMPYAQVHYPFENEAKMEASFPADFIAEYTGQIRAWFYVMHVIGVLVKGSPAFKNVAVTGVINGTDGRKMSKSFGNYPDPRETIEKYGADAIRFYLMGGTLMKGEDMTFSEAGIQESIKRVLLPLWNSYTFFATYANIDGWSTSQMKNEKGKMKNGGSDNKKSDNAPLIKGEQKGDLSGAYTTKKTHELDTWIISRLHTLIQDVRNSMDSYDLQKTCDAIMIFLDGLNNWYIRRNRRRFWRSELDADKKSAYETLHEVLVTMTKLLAPICPFLTEHLYQSLTQGTVILGQESPLYSRDERDPGIQENKLSATAETNKNKGNDNGLDSRLRGNDGKLSVHLSDFPEANTKLINKAVNQKMTDLQNLTNLGLAIRGREKLRVRQPLKEAMIKSKVDLNDEALAVLVEELNVKKVSFIRDIRGHVNITYSPDAKKIGATERKQWMKTILAEAKSGKGVLTDEGNLEIDCAEAPDGKIILSSDEFETVYTSNDSTPDLVFMGSAGYLVGLNVVLDEALTLEGYSRDLIRGIQDARKELGFQVTDRLQLSLTSENALLAQILATHQGMIEKETLTKIAGKQNGDSKEVEIDEDFIVRLMLTK